MKLVSYDLCEMVSVVLVFLSRQEQSDVLLVVAIDVDTAESGPNMCMSDDRKKNCVVDEH